MKREAICGECGTELWRVKTAIDPKADCGACIDRRMRSDRFTRDLHRSVQRDRQQAPSEKR